MATSSTEISPPKASVGGGRQRRRFVVVCAAEAVWLMVLAWMAIRS